MQEEITLKIDKDTYDMIKFLQENLPEEDGKKLSENEILKMAIATFMAVISEQENNEEHHCGCGHCH